MVGYLNRTAGRYGRAVALRKILGIETEYAILIRGAADSNPIAASSVLCG